MQDGGRTLVLHLRRGMKWSDGRPFTADDFVFWFEDMYRNKDLVPTPSAAMAINGKQGEIQKVDAHTVKFKFADPYYLLPDVLAGSTALGGQAHQGLNGMGAYAPAHYLKQFHPKYVVQGRPGQEGQGRQVRQLGAPVPVQERLGAQSGAAGPHAVEDGHPHQHADVDPGAQPLQRLRGHGRQPASLHRQGGPDAWPRTWRSSTCAPSPASTTSRPATSTSARCPSSSRTRPRAATSSTSIPATTAAT